MIERFDDKQDRSRVNQKSSDGKRHIECVWSHLYENLDQTRKFYVSKRLFSTIVFYDKLPVS